MIRPARDDDYAAFASLFPELQIDDPIPTRDRWVDELVRDTLVADVGGAIVGYVSFYKLNTAGHVRNLVVGPAARGGGVGAELMRGAADSLRGAGVCEWHLNVKQDNAAAIRLYEKLGMTVEHHSTAVSFPWTALDRLGDSGASSLPVDVVEDDDIERELHLISGRLAMARKRPGRVMLQLRDDDCAPVGFAAFDPRLPGAYPFRVATPAHAGALLRGIAPHARGHIAIQLVIEDDDALTKLLVAAGATIKLRLLHYFGAL